MKETKDLFAHTPCISLAKYNIRRRVTVIRHFVLSFNEPKLRACALKMIKQAFNQDSVDCYTRHGLPARTQKRIENFLKIQNLQDLLQIL